MSSECVGYVKPVETCCVGRRLGRVSMMATGTEIQTEVRTEIQNKVLPDSDTRPDLSHGDDGDHERFAHYVKRDTIMDSAMSGDPVVALCGKVWVPGRDPQRFPVCPECKKVYESMSTGGGDK